MNDFQHGEITEQIIGAAFEVHGVLGYGFLEKVYENALLAELCKRGVQAKAQNRPHNRDWIHRLDMVI